MMTVKEVSRLTGVSVRTLQYYDTIGLLSPAGRTEAGYRLYDNQALEALQQIMLFRELEFSLKEIKEIVSSPSFDRKQVLDQQIELLTLRKERLEKIIELARRVRAKGVEEMDFTAFDTGKMDEYAQQAKAQWGKTDAYREYEQRTRGWKKEDYQDFGKRFMQLFVEFGQMREGTPESPEAQAQVRKLQDYITDHMYTCTDEILEGLSHLYDAGGEFTENIDAAGGEGTGDFAARAIRVYCQRKADGRS